MLKKVKVVALKQMFVWLEFAKIQQGKKTFWQWFSKIVKNWQCVYILIKNVTDLFGRHGTLKENRGFVIVACDIDVSLSLVAICFKIEHYFR